MIPILISLALAAQPPAAGNELPDIEEIEFAMSQMPAHRDYKTRMTLAGAVLEAGYTYNINPLWLLAVAYAESRWNVNVKPGDKGKSYGVFQIQIRTARAVKFAGLIEGKQSYPKVMFVTLLEDPWSSALVASALWDRLRRKYKKRADIIYNCGFRCGRAKSTRATRAYWRYYRKLKQSIQQLRASYCRLP